MCTYIYTHTYVYIYVQTHTHTHARTHIYTYTHKHIHIYMYICTAKEMLFRTSRPCHVSCSASCNTLDLTRATQPTTQVHSHSHMEQLTTSRLYHASTSTVSIYTNKRPSNWHIIPHPKSTRILVASRPLCPPPLHCT